jgi:ABC-2 type transport system permease protein
MNMTSMSTVAAITLRALFGRRRFLLLLPLPLLVIGLAVLAASMGATTEQIAHPALEALGMAVVLPIMALVISSGVLGSEIDDGTLVHILAKPVPRSEIILAKVGVAIAVTAVTVGVPLYIAGVVAGSARLGLAAMAGAVLGAFAYSGIFAALCLITRRPVVIGLLYVLIWEGTLGGLLSGTRLLSVRHYVMAVADRVDTTGALTSTVSLTTALTMAAVFTVAGTALAVDRLRSFSVAGETS